MERDDDIFKLIKKSSFKNIDNAYLFFKLKYPKIFLLISSIVLAYFIFKNPSISEHLAKINSLGYFGMFFSGMLFAFGFSAAFAVGFFIALQPSNIYLAAVIGGIGALMADILIFKFIKVSFEEEFSRLKKERPIKKLERLMDKSKKYKIGNYLLYFFAGIIIASPLPDEVGVTMLAGLTKINEKILGIISFILNTLGIYVILLISMN